MSKNWKNEIVPLSITHITSKGYGRGVFTREDGVMWKVDVPFTLIGEKVLATLIQKRSGVWRAELKEVLEKSADRVEAKCIHFGTCGGCRIQHVPYDKQLDDKQNRVITFFKELTDRETVIHPMIGCTPPWKYRNKMEFTFSSDKKGEKYLGLIKNQSKGKVLTLTVCHLTNPWFITLLKEVKKWWEATRLDAYHPYRDEGSLRTLTLREGMRTGEKMVILTVSGNPDYALKKPEIQDFVETVKSAVKSDDKVSIFLKIHQIKKGSPSQFYEIRLHGKDHIKEEMTLNGKTFVFRISPSAFFQPNTKQAEKLYNSVLSLANLKSDDVVYDLYCGTATLGISLAQKVKQVIGIELSSASVLDARENITDNKLNNCEIIKGDVGMVLDEIQKTDSHSPPSVVILDPPRAGLNPKALHNLQKLNPETIVYISCNPKTQAENCREILQWGYRIDDLQAVDQFPQTIHIENIAILRK